MLDWASSNLVGTLKSLFGLGKGGTHYLKRDGNDLKFKDPNNAAERTLTELWEADTANVHIDTTGSPAVDRLDEWIDFAGSAGTMPGTYVTDAGGGNVDVAAGPGFIRSSDAHDGDLSSFEWSASLGIAIPTDTVRYIGVEYNAGSPQVVVKTSDVWNDHDEFRLASVVNEGGTLHILNNPQVSGDGVAHVFHRLYETQPFQRADRLGGLILGETGTRNLTVSTGELYDGLNEFIISAIDTSGSDTFDAYYGSFTKVAGQTQWDNNQYDNAGTLTALTTNRWGVHWLYLEADGSLVLIYGTLNVTSKSLAEEATPPTSLPLRLQVHGRIIGRLVFQQGASTATVESAFETTFGATAVTQHNNLAGLQGGTVGQYNHLTDAELLKLQEIQHEYDEDNAEDSHTGNTAYQEKLKFTFTPTSLGYFEITFSCLMACSDEKIAVNTRVQIDDTTTKKETSIPVGGKYSDGRWQDRAGHFVVQLTAASHDIDLDYSIADAGKTVYIKEATLTARRVLG